VNGRYVWMGSALIVIGAAMLLNRLGLLDVEWPVVFWTLVSLFGAYKLAAHIKTRRKGGVFWGTFLLLFGAVKALDYAGTIFVYQFYTIPLIFTLVGISLFAAFLVSPGDWQILVPAVLLLGIGVCMTLADFGYMSRWEVNYAVHHYWPVILILFGAALLLRRKSV
jgi:LiaI-LiaF-like transmembrane region/LiaF transmembrane domain